MKTNGCIDGWMDGWNRADRVHRWMNDNGYIIVNGHINDNGHINVNGHKC